ncbi:sugar ABC transporter substrate-binding protein [Jiangella ureilytica]|uniref:Sugar ABC transporter substrate-binding protein n=1 Tax=Jiangella ureilytica TaxID=2530374 RepID=A0A4V2XVL5_9ACTN|nr:sugar ABC transporter substrate-binding protein [Jiangella ureilytica]TDC45835.1 sugar ABC transporter substrate-binding protein [Jiangella ureilytica]
MVNVRQHPGRHGLAALLPIWLVGSLALAACGGSDGGGDGDSASGACEGVPLKVAVRSQFAPNMEKVLAAYEEESGSDTELQTLPDDNAQYQQSIVAQRMGDEMPDVLENIDTLVNAMAESRVTADLTSFLSDGDLQEDSFLPQFLDAYRPIDLPDEIHGMPVAADAYVLFYNKDLFAQYGVDLPAEDWTWDDFYAAAKEITTAGNGEVFGFVGANLPQPTFNPVIQSYGGFVYDKDSNTTGIGEPEAIEAWTFLLQPYQDGTYAPFEIGSSPSPPDFASGRVAMAFSTRKNVPNFRNQLDADWDVAPVPLLNGEHPIGGGSYGLSMSDRSECKDNAWDFLTWFYTEDGGMKIMQENYATVPPTLEGVESGSWRELPGPPANVQVFADAVSEAKMAPQLPRAAGPELAAALLAAQQKVLLEGASVEDAFGEAAADVNDALEE